MHMTRLTLALAALISLASAAPATLTPRRERTAPGPESTARALTTPRPAVAAGQAGEPEYVLTAETEVVLDGKPCRFADVPARASILRMVVGPDGKTVLKILFRSQK
jgi:hypothetical protein